MSNLIESLKDCSDCIFDIRGNLGAALHRVYFVTRVWSGRSPGEGTKTDSVQEVLPIPGIKEYRHDRRVKEGGTATEGDLVVYHVSKKSYPTEDEVNAKCAAKNIEKFYKIGDYLYRVIHVQERYLSWDIHVRRLTDQRA